MSIEVAMPALSPTMEAGTLARWLVKEGDVVCAGALLAEVETDKATMELEAAEGRRHHPPARAGRDGGRTRRRARRPDDGGQGGRLVAPRPSHRSWPQPPSPTVPPSPSAPAVDASSPAVVVLLAERPVGLKASPLARRMAQVVGIDLAEVKGSGPRGKIVAADVGLPLRAEVLAPAPHAFAAPAPVAARAETPPPSAPHRSVMLNGMRKTIARRLTEAKQTVPHFYLGMDIRMDALFAFRAELNAAAGDGGVKVSVNDLMIKALATALEDTPDANVQFAGDRLLQFDRVDVSLAVAVPGGLVTPVIRDAGGKRLTRIATEAKALAERARGGQADAGRLRGRHRLPLQPRHVRGYPDDARDQPAPGADPRHPGGQRTAVVAGRSDRLGQGHDRERQLRPPRHRWRDRRRLPGPLQTACGATAEHPRLSRNGYSPPVPSFAAT